MNELSKIAKLLSRRGIKNLPLLSIKRDSEQPGLENQLFYNIQDGVYEDDQDASRDIYDAESTDHRYKMLKSRVKQKMLNHLFFLDQEDLNLDRSMILHEDCLKILILGNILILEKDFEIAEKLLNRCYNLAVDAEFTEIVVGSLELLKVIYAENSRPLLLQKNIDEIEDKRALLAIEKQAENIYLKNLVILKKSFNARQKYLEDVAMDLVRIEKIFITTGTSNIFSNYYELFVKYHLISGDYSKVIEFTSKYEKSTEIQKLNGRRFDSIANKFYLLYAFFGDGNYEKALELAEDKIDKIENALYWFKFNEVYFLALMHLGHYAKAMQVVQEVLANKNFNQLDESFKLKWSIYIGFLSFAGIEKTYLKGISMDRVFNIIPDRREQESQNNMAIIVLQIALAVKEWNIETIKKLSREMKYYIYKHPLSTYSPRSRMFLKLVNIMLKCEMDTKMSRKKGRYLYQQLKNTSQFGDAYSDFEVLPYEVIWDRFMELIEKETLSVA